LKAARNKKGIFKKEQSWGRGAIEPSGREKPDEA
jgi:hypothetical protein